MRRQSGTGHRATPGSSRWPRGGSGSPPPTWRRPRNSRSRWPRGRSRVREGSFPGHKVSLEIARLRHTDPGITLISPPPAPRHLLDRGPRPAHLRPQGLQPDDPGIGEARFGAWRGDGGGRGGQGAGRRHPHFGGRGWHRGIAAASRSSTPGRHGSSGWPRPTRCWWPTASAPGSPWRPTAVSGPVVTW